MSKRIHAAPTIIYPESDGEPMAETDKHRDLMVDFIQMLRKHFENVNDVYTSGNLLIYYEEGNTNKSVAPDVFVVFGVSKKARDTYRIWEEGRTPDFVLEVASRNTYQTDITTKKELYATVLNVREYYIYDPYGKVQPHFQGYRLVDGAYQPIDFSDERLPSEALGLELGENDEGTLSLYDPIRKEWLLPPEKRVSQAEQAQQVAEAKLAEALALIEELQKKQGN